MNIVMSLIFVAQIFCWCGVLYQNNMMHVIDVYYHLKIT